MKRVTLDMVEFIEDHVFNVTELARSGKLGQILDGYSDRKSEEVFVVQNDRKKSAKAVIVDLEFFKELLLYREAVNRAADEAVEQQARERLQDKADVSLNSILSDTGIRMEEIESAMHTIELDRDE